MISSVFRSILFGLGKKETPVLEHDIKIIADEGYNGIIAINDSQVTCNYDSVNGFWYWDKPSNLTITSLAYFCCADTRSSVYNQQSTYIKEVYFSENVCTSTCTTLQGIFCFYGNVCNIEYADVSKFDTSNVTSMRMVFAGGGRINNTHGYENWNTANVTNFTYCFSSDYVPNNIDLHNWIVNSTADVANMLSSTTGINFSVFYTPSKWDSNKRAFATLRHDLCIYPYHKINVAANSGFNGKIWNNSTSSFDDLTYDNSLGYWYSDSNLTDLKCALTCGSGSWQNTTASNITSASFKDLTITGNQGVRELFNKDTNLRSVAFVNCDLKSVNDGAYCVAETNCTSITGINELGKNSTAFLYAYFYNRNTSIVTSFVPEITTNRFDYSYIDCTALVNLTFADGFVLQNGANTTNALAGCTALTTIKGNNFTLLETLDLSACPLTLDSAKVILRALGTVTSETLTFKSTTVSLINGDDEALILAYNASQKGWNLPSVETTLVSSITQGTVTKNSIGVSLSIPYDENLILERGVVYTENTSIEPTINDYKIETTSTSKSFSLTLSEAEDATEFLYDTTIYEEPDGSKWRRISHQNNPANTSNQYNVNFGDVSMGNTNSDVWVSTKYDWMLNRHEYMVKQKLTADDTEEKLRWVQNVGLCSAKYSDVSASNVTYNTSSGYSTPYPTTDIGGLWNSCMDSAYQLNNNVLSNTWGRIGQWKQHNNGLAGFKTTTKTGGIVTTGYVDLYVRIDNVKHTLVWGRAYKVRGYVILSDNSIIYGNSSNITPLNVSLAAGNLTAGTSAQTSIPLTGNVTTLNNGNITNTIFARGANNFNYKDAVSRYSTGSNSTSQSYTFTGLTAGTTYYFRYFYVNERGISGTSTVSKATASAGGAPILSSISHSFSKNTQHYTVTTKFTINPNGYNVTSWGTQFVFNNSSSSTSGYTTDTTTGTISSTSTKTVYSSKTITSSGTSYSYYHVRPWAKNSKGTTYGSWVHKSTT